MYATLLTPAFNRLLLAKLTELNESFICDQDTYNRFKDRLAGKNRYCRKGYKGLEQVNLTGRSSQRYHQLNYCFLLHGTLEIRVFPCTKNPDFLRAMIMLVRDVIEDYVAKELVSRKIRFRRG